MSWCWRHPAASASAAIQIAKLFQCRVIATAGGEDKIGKARELGADHVIDHYQQDISAEVKKITGKRGVDVVVEHVGIATWQKSLESLAPGGRLVTCGATTGFDARLDLRFLFSKQWSLLGSFMGTMGELHQVLKFVFRKQLKPVVDRVYPLAEIAAAHRYLENKEQFGKVVVTPLRREHAAASAGLFSWCPGSPGATRSSSWRRTIRSGPPSRRSVPRVPACSWSALAIFIAFVCRVPAGTSVRRCGASPGPLACGTFAAILSWSCGAHLGRQFRVHAGLYEDHELVTHGPYAIVRHPIYTSLLAMLVCTLLLLTPLAVGRDCARALHCRHGDPRAHRGSPAGIAFRRSVSFEYRNAFGPTCHLCDK